MWSSFGKTDNYFVNAVYSGTIKSMHCNALLEKGQVAAGPNVPVNYSLVLNYKLNCWGGARE